MTVATSPRRRGRRIFVLVAIAMVLSILVPLRQLQRSRAELAAMVRQERQIEDGIRQMQLAKKRLSSDAEIARLAREHLHYVLPGEIAFAITGAAPVPTMSEQPAPAKQVQPHRSWYQSFWHWLTG
ncbi:MAG: FtsB family cell division protein [Actinomycetota bacterium]